MEQLARQSSSADGITWHLDDLYRGVDDPQIERDLSEALRRAQTFESTYRNRIDVPGGPTAPFLLAALQSSRASRSKWIAR